MRYFVFYFMYILESGHGSIYQSKIIHSYLCVSKASFPSNTSIVEYLQSIGKHSASITGFQEFKSEQDFMDYAGENVIKEYILTVVDESVRQILDTRIANLEISARLRNVFELNHCDYLGDVVVLSMVDFDKLRNFGPKTKKELIDLLANMGLSLNTNIAGWSRPGTRVITGQS